MHSTIDCTQKGAFSMKKFENPEIQVEHFDVEDVITASSNEPATFRLENTTGIH